MFNSADHEINHAHNDKLPTIFDILTFNSTINITYERLKARNFFICRYFRFYEQSKVYLNISTRHKRADDIPGQIIDGANIAL